MKLKESTPSKNQKNWFIEKYYLKKYDGGGSVKPRIIPGITPGYTIIPGTNIPIHKDAFKKEDNKSTWNEKVGNTLNDTGTKLLHGVTTLGGSVIGDVIKDVSPKAANTLSKYTLGMITITPEEKLIANNNWINRTTNFIDAFNNVVGAEIGGKALIKGAGKLNSLLKKYDFKQLVKPSEINWANWNSEIPQIKGRVREYNWIEKKAKFKKDWMKDFDGTPEQFVQERSKAFKKMYPEGYDKTYRGNSYLSDTYRDNDGIALFGAKDKSVAENYSLWKIEFPSENPYIHPSTFNKVHSGTYVGRNPDGTYLTELLTPKTKTIRLDAEGRNWKLLENNKYLDQSKVDLNMQNIEDLIKNHRRLVPEGFPDIEYNQFVNAYNSGKRFARTDDYADYIMSNKDAPGKVIIDNVIDGGLNPTTVTIVNPWKVPVKSRWFNNGNFDFKNTNIYKSIIPGILGGLLNKTNKADTE